MSRTINPSLKHLLGLWTLLILISVLCYGVGMNEAIAFKPQKEKSVDIDSILYLLDRPIASEETSFIPSSLQKVPSTAMRVTPPPTGDGPHSKRYGTGASKHLAIGWWDGKEPLNREKLLSTITAVYQRLPHIKTTRELKYLTLETMATESELGTHIDSAGNAYGPAQMQLTTAKYLLSWLKDKQPDVFTAVMSFYRKDKNLSQNLTHNVPFGIAMCITYYWHREPNLDPRVKSTLARGTLWKKEYNTFKGKGTVRKYIERCDMIVASRAS